MYYLTRLYVTSVLQTQSAQNRVYKSITETSVFGVQAIVLFSAINHK
jgi:hypothetical protein